MNQRRANLVARVVMGTMPSMDSFVPLHLSGQMHTVGRGSNLKSSSRGEEKEKEGGDAGPANSTSSGYGKVQENPRGVAEEQQKAWKSQQEKDDLLTFKDADLDMSKIAHPSGDG